MGEDGEISIETTKRVLMDIHVHVHFDEPLTLNPVLIAYQHSARAQSASIVLSGVDDVTAINIDTVNEIASVSFVDDHGNPTAAPDGTVATFTASDPTVLGLDNSLDTLTAKIQPLALGVSKIGVTLADANGDPLVQADGDPFPPVPDSDDITVSAGPADSAALTISTSPV